MEELPEQRMGGYGNAVPLDHLPDADIGQYPGIGSRPQELTPLLQILVIKGGGLNNG